MRSVLESSSGGRFNTNRVCTSSSASSNAKRVWGVRDDSGGTHPELVMGDEPSLFVLLWDLCGVPVRLSERLLGRLLFGLLFG
eukprot:5158273-Ditylum_brightwellii.AAC.1